MSGPLQAKPAERVPVALLASGGGSGDRAGSDTATRSSTFPTLLLLD